MWCLRLSPQRMRSTGPGDIRTTRQQSAPETLAVSRRTRYLCALPTWSERTPPSDRKWPRYGRNLAAVATSLVNTRTVLPTSDDGEERNQEEEQKSWIKFMTLNISQGGTMDRMGVKKNGDDDDDDEADDYDDECIRQGGKFV